MVHGVAWEIQMMRFLWFQKNAEEILLTKDPIYRYVPEDKLDTLIRIQKIRFLVLFNKYVDTNKYVPIKTKIAVFCSNAIG